MQLSWLTRAVFTVFLMCFGALAQAAPYAAVVMDARSGKIIHERNANTRLHPASLTKMMTLYLVFEAVQRGELTMDTKVKISKNAAAEPPSKLGLRAGQRIAIRHLVRAAAVKSANDAATALGEAVSGSEAAFTKRMTRKARALGMKRTTFKNAHGLTAKGHMSTARDMTILGRRLMYDFPQYYNLFSRRTTDAGIKNVANTNRRLLSNYKGADGIKTGYTRASGFNLVASAERGEQRIIATVFGGRSSATRNAEVARLLDMGFGKAPRRYASSQPKPGKGTAMRTAKVEPKVIKAPRAAAISKRPRPRPDLKMTPTLVANIEALRIKEAILLAEAESETGVQTDTQPVLVADTSTQQPQVRVASNAAQVPVSKDEQRRKIIEAIALATTLEPAKRAKPAPRVVVERSTNTGKGWAVQLGHYNTRYEAEKILLRTALADLASLNGAVRQIDRATVKGKTLFRARFIGVNQASANKTCARLQARAQECQTVRTGT